jgi:cation transport ATPase
VLHPLHDSLHQRRDARQNLGYGLGYVLVGIACAALFLIGPKLLIWGATLLQRSVGD